MIRRKDDIDHVIELIKEHSEDAYSLDEEFSYKDDSLHQPGRSYIRYRKDETFAWFSQGSNWQDQDWSEIDDIEEFIWKYRKQINNYFRENDDRDYEAEAAEAAEADILNNLL